MTDLWILIGSSSDCTSLIGLARGTYRLTHACTLRIYYWCQTLILGYVSVCLFFPPTVFPKKNFLIFCMKLSLMECKNITFSLFPCRRTVKTMKVVMTITAFQCCTDYSTSLSPNTSFSVSTIPGTKLCLLGNSIPVRQGMLLLREGSVKNLGGEVERLKNKWEVSRVCFVIRTIL